MNEGLCRMLGYTEEELMAKCRGRMTELVYPPDLPQALTDCERCFANSLTYSTEYRMQRKDGKFIWVWDTGSKSKNEEGKTVINSVIVDITERRHTNDTIRRQKAFFQSLYDTTLCALVQYDLNGTFLNANAFTFDVIGYTEEQFRTETGGSLMSIVHPCDVDTVREHIERLIADRRPTVYNCRIIRRDGTVRWLCASANIINNMDGVPVIQAAYSDVTELQRVERERDSTYDSIPGGVAKVLIGTQLSLLEANDNFFQMLGTDRTAYKGTLSAVAPADRGAIVTAFMEAAETDAPVDIEYRCRRFDNERTIWIHLIARFVENAHGAKVYQCVFIDITKQKTAQIQLYRERDRYRIIMENSADVIYEYDRKTDTVVFYETIRRGDENEIAKHVSPNFSKKLYDQKIAHPEDAETVMRVFSAFRADPRKSGSATSSSMGTMSGASCKANPSMRTARLPAWSASSATSRRINASARRRSASSGFSISNCAATMKVSARSIPPQADTSCARLQTRPITIYRHQAFFPKNWRTPSPASYAARTGKHASKP